MAKAGVYLNVVGKVDARAFKRAQAELNKLKRQAEVESAGMSSAFAKASAKLKGIGATARATGRQLTTSLTLPVAAAGIGAAKLAADFETSMNKIVGLVGVPREQVQAWEDDVRRLARTYGSSATEAADALFFITSAGLRGAEATEVLEAALKAQAVGLGDVATIADLATSAMNAYGSDVLSASAATDVMAAAVREGKLEASELSGAMGSTLPVASAMGVSFDEVGAAFAAMSRTGTGASEAATQLRAILTSILKPTEGAHEALASMGLSAEGLRQQIREQGLLSTLETLQDSFGDNEEAVAEVFGNVRALSGVMDMMGSNVDGTRAIFDSMADSTGSLNGAFAEVENTAEFRWNRAMASMKDAALSFGQIILPVVTGVADKLGTIGAAVSNLDPHWQTLIAVALAAVAAVGPLVWLFGALATAAGVLLSPLGLAVAAGVALGAGLKWAYDNVEPFHDAVDELGRRLGAVAEEIRGADLSFLAEQAQSVADTWRNTIWPTLQGFIALLVEDVAPTVRDFVSDVAGHIGDLVGFFQERWDKIKQVVERAIWAVLGVVQGVLLTLRAAWDRFGDDVLRIVSAAFGLVKDTIGNALQLIKGVIDVVLGVLTGDWSEAWEGIKNIVGAIWDQIGNILSAAWEAITGIFGAGFQVVQDLWNLGWLAISNIASNAWAAFTGWLSGVWEGLTGWWSEKWTNMGDTVARAWENITSKARQGVDDVVGFVQGLPGRITEQVGAVLTAATELGSNIITGIKDGVTGAVGFVSDIASALWKAVKDLINTQVIDRMNEGIPNSLGWGPAKIDLPDNPIPRLADGGIVRARPGGTLALIAEAGRDEAVVPLPRNGMPAIGGGGVMVAPGAVQLRVEITGDADRSVVDEIDRRVRLAFAELIASLEAGEAA